MMYSLDEVGLLGSAHPIDINHRSEVNPFDENGKLPIFVSPMTCIIDKNNYEEFKNSKFIPIIPRTVNPEGVNPLDWKAYALGEFELLLKNKVDLNGRHILIDIANGHMQTLFDAVKFAKTYWPDVVIMIGNIVNPDIYMDCCLAGVDYVRCTVGTGSACTTGVLTGIHVSHEYMLRKIRTIKACIGTEKLPKIIIDGGINTIDKAIKCLALGADYVMMGKMFAKCEEASGYIVSKFPKKRAYYGMASAQGQIDMYGSVVKNPEGTLIHVEVDTTLNEFAKLFTDALQSSMSYTGCHTLDEFKHNVEWEYQTPWEFQSYYKELPKNRVL